MKKVLIFNKWKLQYIYLEKGECFCDKCSGIGASVKIIKSSCCVGPTKLMTKILTKCSRCSGNGKLDWISKITNYNNEKIETKIIRKFSNDINEPKEKLLISSKED
jgi:hypothetical protein